MGGSNVWVSGWWTDVGASTMQYATYDGNIVQFTEQETCIVFVPTYEILNGYLDDGCAKFICIL